MYRVPLNIKILSLIVSLIVIASISAFEFALGNAYYVILFASLLILLITGRRPKFNYLMLWLCAAGIISILLNDIPSFFKPYERFLAFCIVLALVGPLLKTYRLNLFKLQLLKTINIIIVVCITFSFIGLCIKLPIVNGWSGFNGFFNHSMLLGPMAAFSMLTSINWARNHNKNKMSFIYYMLASISFITCVTAGSRSALLAGILAGLFLFYKTSQGNLLKYLKIVFVISCLALITFPLWESSTEHINRKMEVFEERGSDLGERGILWERRLSEFISSPLYGIGFANDSSLSQNELYIEEGKVEPGSSWLLVLSMLGILGLMPFVSIFGSSLYFIFKSNLQPKLLPYLGSILIFFGIHMVGEGYVFAAGSGIIIYFWLILGVISIFQQGKSVSKLSIIVKNININNRHK